MKTLHGLPAALLSSAMLCGAVGAVGAVGCAGSQKEVREDNPTPVAEAPARQSPDEGIPPDKLDEVQSIFRRKTTTVQSCYTDEMERNGNKKIEGDVALSMTLAPSGKAENVKVERSTLKSPAIEECVVTQVRSWDFGPLPSRGFFTWTFNFKPAY